MKNTIMLKKNYEFKNILSKGKYYTGKKIEAFILNNEFDYNLLGLAIGVKKGKATKRNHLKRLLRENYYFYERKIKSGYSIVFLCKKNVEITEITFDEIKKDMYIIFNNANILIEEEK